VETVWCPSGKQCHHFRKNSSLVKQHCSLTIAGKMVSILVSFLFPLTPRKTYNTRTEQLCSDVLQVNFTSVQFECCMVFLRLVETKRFNRASLILMVISEVLLSQSCLVS
jgi:hypothetical protein